MSVLFSQHLSVVVRQFNRVLLQDSFSVEYQPDY